MMVAIKIFKNGELLRECDSIQQAGGFLQQHTGDRYKRFRAIQNGYCYGETWSFNGASYTFKAPERAASNRRKQLESQKK